MDRTLLIGIAVITILVVSLVAGAFTILAYTGIFQGSTDLTANIKNLGTGCSGSYVYSIELKNSDKRGIAQQEISAYVNGVLLEKLLTDQNGRLSSTKDIPSDWCGKKTNFTFVFNGDSFHKNARYNTTTVFKTPTSLQLSTPNETLNSSPTSMAVKLTNSINNTGIPNQKISIFTDINAEITTDKSGKGNINIVFNQTGSKKIRASFFGSEYLLPSESDISILNVVPYSCSDGTYIGQCSKQVSLYCSSQKELVFDCSRCGCNPGLACSKNTCVTPEKATTDLVSELQKSIVKIEHSSATGSGVILAHSNGQTIVLTNKHVIQDATSVADVKVLTNDQKTISAAGIRIAPNDMDFAAVYLNGIYGEPVKINSSKKYLQGQSVLALGSPLGIQGSVSNGIISNFVSTQTNTNYKYSLIQTDAAINPGNSGGGLFDKESGELIGINSLKIAESNVEGLGFAIDIKEFQKLTPYSSWQEFLAIPRCSDGTPYGTCSTSKELLCSNGNLVPACKVCGCPSNFPYCSVDGTCFNCANGALPYRDGNNNVFCCPSGYTAYSDSNGNGFCCESGTHGTTGGTCNPN